MNSENFPKLTRAIKDGMARGQHIGAVVHVRRDGEAMADFALGAACLEPGGKLEPGHKMLLLSAGKPLTALAVGILVDRGRVALDSPVAEFIPDFASNGKDDITVRHVLTHTHAYKPPRLDWPRKSRDEIIALICDAEPIPDTMPGEYAAYDAQSGWYLLSEIVERVTGLANDEFVKTELLEPLGCTGISIGMSAGTWTAARDSGDLAVLHDTTGSAREQIDLRDSVEAVRSGAEEIPNVESGSQWPHPWAGDDAQRAEARNPGGGAVGTAQDLAKIYEFLLNGGRVGGNTWLLRQETVREMTARQREGLKDHTFGQVIDWGYGFLINSARYGALANPYGYGRHASDDTFGHGGMQSSAGFADPGHGIAGAIIFNGLPGEPKHVRRINDAMTALYEDLGLG